MHDATHDAAHLLHLDVIRLRLSHERERVRTCKPRDRTWREHNVRMIEREEASHVAFLAKRGIVATAEPDAMTDDELLDALLNDPLLA